MRLAGFRSSGDHAADPNCILQGVPLEIDLRPFFRFSELSKPAEALFLGLRKARYSMSSIAILREVMQLYNVSDRLDSIAEQHPVVSAALLTISGSVRNTATLLEVLVATKITPLAGLDPAADA